MAGEIVIRFEDVSFEYTPNKPIIDEVSFTVRRGSKVTIMGQNGAGKSTLFKLIRKTLEPTAGEIHIGQRLSIAESRQVIPRDELTLTVRDFFQKQFSEKIYDIDPRINKILEVVNLIPPHGKVVHNMKINEFSGGQQARPDATLG
jgi:ATPase subunit of ABC transporter with duplicated ATPase domains